MPKTQKSVFILFPSPPTPQIILEKEIITELFITDKWIEVEVVHGLHIYICAYNCVHKTLIAFRLELDGGKLGRNLGFQWQGILVGCRQVCSQISQKSAELVFCGRSYKHQKKIVC